jgi:hypothetical protein
VAAVDQHACYHLLFSWRATRACHVGGARPHAG